MTMITVGGDHLIAILCAHLQADDHCFLANVKVAEPADKTHAVELAGLLLKASNKEHLAIGAKLLLWLERRNRFVHRRV